MRPAMVAPARRALAREILPAVIFLGFPLEYTRIFLLALIGGWLGVLFMIPLRRQLIVGEHAILFEREKRADAQHERRHSAAGTIKLNRHASLPA